MPSNTAVPYMKAWVMTLTFASRSGTKPPWKYATRSSVEAGPCAEAGAAAGVASEPCGFWVSMRVTSCTAAVDAAAARILARRDSVPDEREVPEIEQPADEEPASAEPAGPRHRHEDRRAREARDPRRGKSEVAPRSRDPAVRREDQRHRHRDGGLEDHRARDVAHR